MRIRPTALLAVLLLGACTLTPNEPLQPEPLTPLDAHVWVGGLGHVTFSTNRPAYVAVFEISPYDGVGLLYPQFGGQEAQSVSGLGWVFPGIGTHRWAYFSQTGGSLLASTYLGPRYIFMIASERPLDVSDYVARPFELRKVLGYNEFQARRPFETMDRLAAMAIRDPDGSKWATDVYMVWPEVRPPASRYVLVNCSGQLLRVPFEYAFYVSRSCAPATNVIAVEAPQPTGGDTVKAIAKVEQRGRGRNPAPVGTGASSVDAQTVDRYLLGREAFGERARDASDLRRGVPLEPTEPGRFTGAEGRGTSSFEERQRRVRQARPDWLYDRGRTSPTESRRLTHPPAASGGRAQTPPRSTQSERPARTSPARVRSSPPVRSAPAPRSSPRPAASHPAPPAGSSSGSGQGKGHGH